MAYICTYIHIYVCVYVYVHLRHHPLLEGRHTPSVKNLPAVQETQVQSLGWEDPWRREWQPTPIFLPGESLGQRSLVGYIQYIGSQRGGHDWATNTFTKSCSFFYITNTMSRMLGVLNKCLLNQNENSMFWKMIVYKQHY